MVSLLQHFIQICGIICRIFGFIQFTLCALKEEAALASSVEKHDLSAVMDALAFAYQSRGQADFSALYLLLCTFNGFSFLY